MVAVQMKTKLKQYRTRRIYCTEMMLEDSSPGELVDSVRRSEMAFPRMVENCVTYSTKRIGCG